MTREELQIKPAGRHLRTIGEKLIKDKYAAIVELVKNAYDADSPECKISLLPFEQYNSETKEMDRGIKVIVKDKGHGMTYETVTKKWLVPSTNDKEIRKESPGGRMMQGKKGIGRYSASIIGDEMELQTVDTNGNFTRIQIEWSKFDQAEYLEQVTIPVEHEQTNQPSGTTIIMTGDEEYLDEWNPKQIQNLKFELKKLIPPGENQQDFKITLELGEFDWEEYHNITEELEPYPLLELYDYRISGTVSANGLATLTFENKRIKDTHAEEISPFTIHLDMDPNTEHQAYCGDILVDFRVFDRDPASIDGLIERGLKDPVTGNSVGKRQARLLLDQYNGIGVYRHNFRLRPLGDPGYDWLLLDKKRVQNPSQRVGCDQVIGFIHIDSEENSGLEEKSARDGLKENAEYFGLKEIAAQTLGLLETRRFIYRKRVGLGRTAQATRENILKLYNFKDLQEKIHQELDQLGISRESRAGIDKLISEKEQANNRIADELEQTIALYQGQATLGKIVNVVLHEGRKPLSYFKNQIPNILAWKDMLITQYNEQLLQKIAEGLTDVKEQSDILTRLFEKLDPLSAKKRGQKKNFRILKTIEGVINVFSSQIKSQNIEVHIDCQSGIQYKGWHEDFYIALTNLVDNSLYWLQQNKEKTKQIIFRVYEDEEENTLVIEYRDNGPGINKEEIESGVIFEPWYTGKTGGGSGLGLAIAGEAIHRNDGRLEAIYSETGAFFRIETKRETEA